MYEVGLKFVIFLWCLVSTTVVLVSGDLVMVLILLIGYCSYRSSLLLLPISSSTVTSSSDQYYCSTSTDALNDTPRPDREPVLRALI